MKNKSPFFEEIEHSADFGLKLKAEKIEELFEVGAHAIKEKVVKNFEIKNKVLKKIKIKGETLEEIFIEWLNEIIYLLFYKKMVLNKLKNISISEKNLEAEVLFYRVDKIDFEFEIKAATFHNLKIEKNEEGYIAEVIFDV